MSDTVGSYPFPSFFFSVDLCPNQDRRRELLDVGGRLKRFFYLLLSIFVYRGVVPASGGGWHEFIFGNVLLARGDDQKTLIQTEPANTREWDAIFAQLVQ